MNAFKTALPNFMKDSLLCFTLVNSQVLEEAPDVTVCTTNGYLYECKNKKIIRCLNLGQKGAFITCSYVILQDKLFLFYVILTTNHELFIIRRNEIRLEVTKTYEQVEKFEVYDFDCLGFPKVKINFILKNSLIFEFADESSTDRTENRDQSNLGNDLPICPLAKTLADKLQTLYKHINELTEEYNHLKNICLPGEVETSLGVIPVGSIKFNSSIKRIVKPEIKVLEKWDKVFGTMFILGIKICNTSCELINDLEVLVSHEKINGYAYRIFLSDEITETDLFSCQKVTSFVKPGDTICVLVTFTVPEFFTESKLTLSCYLFSAVSKDFLLKESFNVNVLDIASKKTDEFQSGFAGIGSPKGFANFKSCWHLQWLHRATETTEWLQVFGVNVWEKPDFDAAWYPQNEEDMMALRTVQTETRLRVETENSEDDLMEKILMKELGFVRIKNLKDKLFYCTSTYLKNVFVGLRQIAANPSVWKMVLYTREPSEIYFLVNALYELLPEDTGILLDD